MRLCSGCLMKLPAEGKVKRFPGAAAVPALSSTHSLILVQPNVLPRLSVTLWWQNIKRYSYSFLFCFHKKKRKGKYFCAAVWKVSVKSRQSILFIYFFCHSGTRGLSITPVSGQTAPSHELPQTHLQKIRHEIVWLLHHRAICTSSSSSSSSSSSHLHSFPFCSLPGLHVSGTASPSRPPLAFLFFFLPVFHIHASSSQRAPGHRGPRL